MRPKFIATDSPSAAQIAAIEEANPYSPFNTAAYASASRLLGATVCLFALESNSDSLSGCLGFLEKGALSRRLEIVSASQPSHPDIFWSGVFDFCREKGVWDLDIQTYASSPVEIPSVPGELNRRERCEWTLDLESISIPAGFTENHRRNVKKGVKAGLTIKRSSDPGDSRSHLRLMQASMERRKARGEDVETPDSTEFFEAMLKTGAAELFQAFEGDALLSSIMLARSKYAAYYQTSGASPEGMKAGSSHFLVSEVAKILIDENVKQFNLAGAGADEHGLRDYKSGFGAQPVLLEAASFSTVSQVKRSLRSAARLIRSNPGAIFAALRAKAKKI